MLYIVSTPIGNLGDITYRAVEILHTVDYILCEDTRVSKKLLDHYEIKKPLRRFDQHKEKLLSPDLVLDIQAGKNIALISDAGTPLIHDPGAELLSLLIENNLPYTVVPGPSSPIAALLLSGFPPVPFHFFGFIPKGKKGEALIEEALANKGTLLFFETAPRIHASLNVIDRLAPARPLAIAREITKLYEEVIRGDAKTLLAREYRGEIVLVVGPGETPPPMPLEEGAIEKQYEDLLEAGLHPKAAMGEVAKATGLAKKELYMRLRIK